MRNATRVAGCARKRQAYAHAYLGYLALEIAISGAVHIRASTDFFLRMYKDIERFDTAALAIKKISDPPKREDFATMELPDKELAALKTCRPNDCNMKFGQETMDLLAKIDWSTPDATEQAEDLIRERFRGHDGVPRERQRVQNDVMKNMQGYLDSTKIAIERYYAERRR